MLIVIYLTVISYDPLTTSTRSPKHIYHVVFDL